MKLISKRLLGVALISLGFAQVVHCSSPTIKPPKAVKVKIVKTDFESRRQIWSYRVLPEGEKSSLATPYKTIKKDRTISYIPGPTVRLEICTGSLGKGHCQRNALDGTSKLLAIDKEGRTSAKDENQIKQLIAADTVPKMVKVQVLIPEKFKAPFTLTASPNQNNKPIYQKVKVAGDLQTKRDGKPYHIVGIEIPSNRDSIYLTIDQAKGKKITKKVVMSESHPIKENSQITMGTSEDNFFVE